MISITYNPQAGIADVDVDQDATDLEFIKFCDYMESNKSLSRVLNILVKAPVGFKTFDKTKLFAITSHYKRVIKSYDKISVAFAISNECSSELIYQFRSLLDEQQKNSFFICKSIKEAKRVLRRHSSSLTVNHLNVG